MTMSGLRSAIKIILVASEDDILEAKSDTLSGMNLKIEEFDEIRRQIE